jgi:hypothetical protein
MHQHGRGGAVEGAAAGEHELAAAALLGRGAEHGDPPAERLRQPRQGEAGAEARRRDHVVPAGVPDAW